ncbi:DUF2955 domain-containing protein [Cupriavidus basilensis]
MASVLLPFLRHYPFSGVLMTGLGLFLAFRYGLRGGNSLVGTLPGGRPDHDFGSGHRGRWPRPSP